MARLGPSTNPPSVPLAVALTGYLAAVQRYGEARASAADQHAAARLLVPLTEALWWACAIDEQLGPRCTRAGVAVRQTGLPRAARERPARPGCDGDALCPQPRRGPARPRRRVHARAHRSPLPARFGDYKWRHPSDLPPGPASKDAPQYEKHLVGRPVTYALEDAAAWFQKQPELHPDASGEPAAR